MQFDLRKFIVSGTKPYVAEFQCDLSAKDFAGARIEQPVTARFETFGHLLPAPGTQARAVSAAYAARVRFGPLPIGIGAVAWFVVCLFSIITIRYI